MTSFQENPEKTIVKNKHL